MRRIANLAVVLLLGAAGTGAATGFGGSASAVSSVHASVMGADGSYTALTEVVSAVPEGSALPPQAEDRLRPTVAALAAQAGLTCRNIHHLMRGREEHPAYTVVTALCDCAGGRGRQINVMLFSTGRAAVISLGEVTVEDGPAGVRYYAF